MLKELKQKREQRKDELKESFDSRKFDFSEKYKKYFPKPKLDKSTDHFLAENQ
jgi:hypothetical protein